jgi:C1A family cysteine protease
MMKQIIFALLLLVAVQAGTLQQNIQAFQAFITQYGKTYSDLEYGYRFNVFVENLARAAAYQAAETGTARYGVTQFMDLTPDEFRANYLLPKDLFKNFKVDPAKVMKPLTPVPVPTTFDWRDKGAVTPVKDQGQCGSCWAFSATETIESYHFLAGKPLISLSPQQIVDCDKTSYGCNGGWTQHAFDYVEKSRGLDTEASYPYHATDGTCRANEGVVGATISSWKYITQNDDENAMLQAAYQTGPLSICVDASSWAYYKGGVIRSCGTQVDHCVVITGFTNIGGVDAWTVRNSWGTSWGVGGYLYVERGHNVCAIGSCVTVVTAQ